MPSAVLSHDSTRTALHWGRLVAMGAVAVLILLAGLWSSWGTAQDVMLTKGHERGTVAVTGCDSDVCTGRFTPSSPGAKPRDRVVLDNSVAVRKGGTYEVVLRPDSDEALRGGPAGVLHAWLPLGGALLLASVVVGGGLRATRTAWGLAAAGVALLSVAFALI
jgi:hypothetical protein